MDKEERERERIRERAHFSVSKKECMSFMHDVIECVHIQLVTCTCNIHCSQCTCATTNIICLDMLSVVIVTFSVYQ